MSQVNDRYGKAGREVIGYRFLSWDKANNGFYHAEMTIRRLEVADCAAQIAERIRYGASDVDYIVRKAQALRSGGSPHGKYLYSSSMSNDTVTLTWQANYRDCNDNVEQDPRWYGCRLEGGCPTSWVAKIVTRIAKHFESTNIDRLYATPQDVINALNPCVPIRYISDADAYIIDTAPDFVPRQLTYLKAEAPVAVEAA